MTSAVFLNDSHFLFVFITVALTIRLSSIVADAIVVSATWRKTFGQMRGASQLGIHATVSATLLKDGKHPELSCAAFSKTHLSREYILCVSGFLQGD